MTTHADFASYKPLKLGVATQPPALIVKYLDAHSARPKHHQVRLDRFRDNLDPAAIRDFVLHRHGPYFSADRVSSAALDRLILKLVRKCRQSAEPKQPARLDRKPTPAETDARPRSGATEVTPDAGRKQSRSLVKPHSPIEESLGDFEEEDELRSEDLGLGRKGLSHSKLSQEGLPSIFKNPSLSRSKLSGPPDSLKDKDKKPLAKPVPNEQSKPAKDKVFFDSHKKPEPIVSPKPANTKDDFDEDFDDFDELPFDESKKSSVRKSQARVGKDKSPPKEDFDDDFDDFEDIKSELSKSKPSARPKKPDDDGFDDIPDEDEEELARSQLSRRNGTQEAKQSRFSDLNFDYRTLDLNKLNDEEVQLVKKTMDKEFRQLRPGDPGFQYEKSASFVQEESNDWDG